MAALESTMIPYAHGMRSSPPATPPRESPVDRVPQPSPQSRTTSAAKPRKLTVGYSYPPESHKPSSNLSTTAIKPVPNVRLCGLWLRNAGFTIGQRIKVEVSEGRLTIVPAD